MNKTILGASVALTTPVLLATAAGASPTVPDASDTVTSIAQQGGPEVGAVIVAGAVASVAIAALAFAARKGRKAMFGRG